MESHYPVSSPKEGIERERSHQPDGGAAIAQNAIAGESAPLRRALEQVERVAATDSTVLLLGETGTGRWSASTARRFRQR